MARRQLLVERARATAKEAVDPTPVEMTIGNRPPSMEDRLKDYIRQQISLNAVHDGKGSFDDEDDFELTEEEEAILEPYPVQDMHPVTPDDSPLETIEGDAETPPPAEVVTEPPDPEPPSGNA